MTDTEQKNAAKAFAKEWKDKGYEKGESQKFWLSLLHNVYGIEQPEDYIIFEEQVHLDNTSFIDGMIPSTKVMIEQKGVGKDLNKPIKQSDGSLLTPFQQAKRYITELPVSQHPRWVITCNFSTFYVYDMERPGGDPEVIQLKDLPKEYYRLQFLVDTGNEHLKKEMEVSIKAGEIVGLLYDAFADKYADLTNEHSMHSLNVLCVRLVFCLYAENAGLFGRYGIFHDYMESFETNQMRRALIDLFKVLDTPEDKRDPYLKEDNPELSAFPYVNGGLFSDEDIEVPPFTDDIRDLLLEKASAGFNWSEISPTIFGAVFESTLNPETRRSGGMHYTSVENIHKVIDPLFLDDLKKEFQNICDIQVERTRTKKLEDFQKKLASLTFLDPACGSGNFLTESYLSLRRMENDVLRELKHGQISLGLEGINPIQVSLKQFYGIEINDFAVTVAKTALWIAESQMMQETESIVMMDLDFLPLKSYTNIVEGNALRIDWNEVVSKFELNYIMGNPPFVGSSRLSEEQKDDRRVIFSDNGGELDYVSCWYKKAADYIGNYPIRCAFVSTNSICQGQQVVPLWEPLMKSGIVINFAYTTFIWDSEASIKAHVYCIIIGFSRIKSNENKLYNVHGSYKIVDNINAYLMAADNVFIKGRSHPICAVPNVCYGFKPADNGNLILSDDAKEDLISKEPEAEKWIRPFITAKEYIHGKTRWCLWLEGITPAELNNLPIIKSRVSACKEWREQQKKTGDAYKLRNIPTLMRPTSKFKEGPFIIFPLHTGDRRRYVPFGFSQDGAIPGNSVSVAFDVNLYHFGILSSNVHNAWNSVLCGRLGTSFRYSPNIVYNNFPWPNPTDEQKATIEQTAQGILDARAIYPDSSLADLYDEITMPPELRRAHQLNDKAVMAAYGWTGKDEAFHSESACVAELMKLYEELADKEQNK